MPRIWGGRNQDPLGLPILTLNAGEVDCPDPPPQASLRLSLLRSVFISLACANWKDNEPDSPKYCGARNFSAKPSSGQAQKDDSRAHQDHGSMRHGGRGRSEEHTSE